MTDCPFLPFPPPHAPFCRRVNVWRSTRFALALKRIARRYGVTQHVMIEKLLLAEDERILDEIADDSAEWNKYFGIATQAH
jgi:hypothetical protein